MRFFYHAKERNGTVQDGVIEADSLADARQRLRGQGLFLLSISPSSVTATTTRQLLQRRPRKSEMLMFLSQLTIMLQSGVDLAEALDNVAEQCETPVLKSVLERVSQDVASGSSFSESLAKHPKLFDESFVAGVAAGEHSGAVAPVLERLTQLLRNDMRLQNTIWSMLTYPIVLCMVTFLVLNALIFFVLPQFAKVFADLDKPTPPLTQLLLGAGQFLSENIVGVLSALAVIVIVAYSVRKLPVITHLRDSAALNLAVIRHATRALSTGRAFRLLGTMLLSGVQLIDGIRLCRSSARNRLFRELFAKVEHDMLRGEGIGKALLEAKFLPSGAARMVMTAERSGNLGAVLQTVGEYFEDEGERHVRDLVKVLEPAVIVFLGVIVAMVVLSIVLPLLDVSTVSH